MPTFGPKIGPNLTLTRRGLVGGKSAWPERFCGWVVKSQGYAPELLSFYLRTLALMPRHVHLNFSLAQV